MTTEHAEAIYRQFAVKVKHSPTKSFTCHIPKNGILRKGQRPIPGHMVTTKAEYFAALDQVRQAVAVLDAVAPVETPEPDAQLSFLAVA